MVGRLKIIQIFVASVSLKPHNCIHMIRSTIYLGITYETLSTKPNQRSSFESDWSNWNIVRDGGVIFKGVSERIFGTAKNKSRFEIESLTCRKEIIFNSEGHFPLWVIARLLLHLG